MHRRQRLVTSGADGRAVVWQIALAHASRLIEPLKAVALKAADIPKELKKNTLTTKGGRGMHFVHPGEESCYWSRCRNVACSNFNCRHIDRTNNDTTDRMTVDSELQFVIIHWPYFALDFSPFNCNDLNLFFT